MIVKDFCTMNCANCHFTDGLVYTSMPPKYKCTFDNNFYDGWHQCHLELAPVGHAAWIVVDGYYSYSLTCNIPMYRCSNCKNEEYYKTNYCPNCGFKMDLER